MAVSIRDAQDVSRFCKAMGNANASAVGQNPFFKDVSIFLTPYDILITILIISHSPAIEKTLLDFSVRLLRMWEQGKNYPHK